MLLFFCKIILVVNPLKWNWLIKAYVLLNLWYCQINSPKFMQFTFLSIVCESALFPHLGLYLVSYNFNIFTNLTWKIVCLYFDSNFFIYEWGWAFFLKLTGLLKFICILRGGNHLSILSFLLNMSLLNITISFLSVIKIAQFHPLCYLLKVFICHKFLNIFL